MDDDGELRNPFPSPPSHYKRYTSHNLQLLVLLKDRTDDIETADQTQLLNDQSDVPDWPLSQLEKPRVDWILDEEEPYYDVYGERWFVKEKLPSLQESGGTQLYPSDPLVDRRLSLVSILRSMLVSYSSLTSALLSPPPLASNHERPPDWHGHVEWLTILGQNLMAAANELRPARTNVEVMMKRQLELRREETRDLHSQCDALQAKLETLGGLAESIITESHKNKRAKNVQDDPEDKPITRKEIADWAEEIG